MNGLRRALLLSALLPLTPCPAAPTPPPTAATQDLLDDPANAGLKAMIDGDDLVALYGVPFATDSDGQTTTYDFVDYWLLDPVDGNKDALGVDDVVLVFDRQVDTGDGKFTVFVYTQEIENLPVFGSRVTIPVLRGSTEKIGYIGIRLKLHPETALLPDVLVDPEAVDDVILVSPEYAHLTTFSTPAMVVYQDDDDALHRAWRLTGSDDDDAYLFFVDTNNSEIVGAIDMIVDFEVSGTVKGFATAGTTADYPPDPNRPAPGLPNGNPATYPILNDMSGITVNAINAQGQTVQATSANADGTYYSDTDYVNRYDSYRSGAHST